jgi:UDP-N-acetylmuramoyl-tripeptide--D-alanyl-D-alanine ligase
VVVPDTLKAFSVLAAFWRKKIGLPTLAITGSVGKTTTKELAASILMQTGIGNYSKKSFNNHTGVPYTILQTAAHHGWLVLEVGMNHAGEIRRLSELASPDVAMITKIAPAHIEHFAGIEGIVDAKCEILSGLVPGGTVVLNGDDQLLREGITRNDPSRRHPQTFFGTAADSTVRIVSVVSKGLGGLEVKLRLPDGEISTVVGILGSHNVTNIAAAVAGVRTLVPTISLKAIEEGLRSFRAPLMRLNLKRLTDGRTLVDDSYNANPTSMAGILSVAKDLASGGEKIGLVLGDMLELGERSEEFHRELGRAVGALKPTFLITVGDRARWIGEEAKALGVRSTHAENPEVAAHLVAKCDFQIVIVKGSRGVNLDRTAEILFERCGERP